MKKTLVNKAVRYFSKQSRDPRYVFSLAISAVVFIACSLQVMDKGLFDSIEAPIFSFFNGWPDFLHGIMLALTQFGGLGGLVFWMGVGWYLVNKRAALSVLWTGIVGWLLAKAAKGFFGRGRPLALLHHVNIFKGEIFAGNGYPSGHSTFSAACATVLYYQVPKKYRKYILLLVTLVGVSRMYLGAHFPFDVLGGWALGVFTGSLAMLVFGISKKGMSIRRVRSFLTKKDYDIKSIKFANVDARGSKPFFMTLKNGDEVFGKLFGVQEHAADWLFKIFRFFRYKNLQAEEPYANSRRNVEMEAFATIWAKNNGIRVPNVIDLMQLGTSWLLLQEKIDAIPLAEHGHILESTLTDTWKQVKKLHEARVAHRDLRAANIMIDKSGQAWIIDFGFAEVSASKQRLRMDNAELLMSMGVAAGIERTVDAAIGVLGKEEVKHTLPYLQKAVFSGATTKLIKRTKLLSELRDYIYEKLDIKDEVVQADIQRINIKKLINITLFSIFIYIIAPQFSEFKSAFSTIHIASPLWFLLLAAASLSTYVFTGLIYVSLAQVPLKLWRASFVQLAASFMSKILPGGIGNTGLNYKFLQKSGMQPEDSSAVIAAQGAIGFVMFIVPLGLFLFLSGQGIAQLVQIHIKITYVFIIALILLVFLAIVFSIKKLRIFIQEKLLSFISTIRNIGTPSRELGFAALASLSVTLAYILCLYASVKILGFGLSITSVVFVYATAIIAKSAVPTPGGIGPLETAMVATMVSLGLDKQAAFSIVIVYRLATFWIPIPFSLGAYRYVQKKKII